jgi:hypothetical protein
VKDVFVIPRRRSKPDSGLRAIFRKHLPSFDITSIETGITITGVPDANFCCAGVEGWIEMKACTHWQVGIRAAQIGWIEHRLDHGGRVFIAVRRAQRELWLFYGSMVRQLQDRRLDKVPRLGLWDGGPARWDWDAVAILLTRDYKLS